MNARYNRALYLHESGETGQAAEVLAADADLHRQFSEPWVQLASHGYGEGSLLRKDLASARRPSWSPGIAFLDPHWSNLT